MADSQYNIDHSGLRYSTICNNSFPNHRNNVRSQESKYKLVPRQEILATGLPLTYIAHYCTIIASYLNILICTSDLIT